MSHVRKRLIVALVVFVLSAAGVAVSSQLFGRSTADDQQRLATPYQEVANTFRVPVGARVAFPDTPTSERPGIVKGWQAIGNVDEACTVWREAFRSWVGVGVEQTINGDYSPGQSCSYQSPLGTFQTKLTVAVYAGSEPQVTLTVDDRVAR